MVTLEYENAHGRFPQAVCVCVSVFSVRLQYVLEQMHGVVMELHCHQVLMFVAAMQYTNSSM